MIKKLLDLNEDIILIIFSPIKFNFRLINKQYKTICDNNNLSKNIFIFESINILQWAISSGYDLTDNTLNQAIANSDLTIVKWLKSNGCNWKNNTLSYAEDRGKLSKIIPNKDGWFLQNLNINLLAKNSSLTHSCLENMRWLKQEGCPVDVEEGSLNSAILNGNLDVMKLLFEYGCKWCDISFVMAAYHGNLDNMKWLKEIGCPMTPRVFATAIYSTACSPAPRYPHSCLDNIKWLLENDCPWNATSFDSAVQKGDFEIMEWLFENYCPWDEDTFKVAVDNTCKEGLNNVPDIVKWLLEYGCPYNENIFKVAVNNNNSNVIKLLLEDGCPYNENIFKVAVDNNNSDVIKLLLEDGCSWDKDIFRVVVDNASKADPNNVIGNLDVIKLLFKYDCSLNKDIFRLAVENASKLKQISKHEYASLDNVSDCKFFGNLDVIEWLFKNNCPWDEDIFIIAVDNGNLDVMKCLKNNGCPLNYNIYQRAINRKLIKKIAYLCSYRTYRKTKNINFDKVVVWLEENGCPMTK